MFFEEKNTLDLGTTRIYNTRIRSTELVHRVWWFIEMRWIAIIICLAGYIFALFNPLPVNLNSDYFLLTSILLFVFNIIYLIAGKKLSLSDDKENERKIRYIVICQVIIDFIALSIISYACGIIETPILILYIGHIILITLFFSRRLSLFLTIVGMLFASVPILLEQSLIIPTISVFNSSFKQVIYASLPMTLFLIAGLLSCYMFCWYLVSEISLGLASREFQLEQAHSLLVKLDRQKTQNALRTTHELKAPLAAIKSYVFTLIDGYCGILPDKATNVVTRIGERCDKLLADISDIIRLNNLKNIIMTPEDFKQINLNDILVKEIENAKPFADSKKIQIISKYGEKELFIKALSEHIKMLVSNLIQNAIIYSNPDKNIEIITEKKEDKVILHVIDYGIGIAKENIENIFAEHFRANEAVRINPNGNGLGLSIVKEIVNLHNAEIFADSEPGKGAHFTVSFKTC